MSSSEPAAAQSPPPPPPPGGGTWGVEPTPKRSRKRLWLVAALVAVVVAGGIAIGLAVTRSSAAKLQINGTMSLLDTSGDGIQVTGDKTCTGSGGYSDIQAGAEVVISDDKGATLAITHLTGGGGLSISCVFSFAAEVPAGKGFYGVTVSHRGTVKMSEAEVAHAAVSLGN
jgi:hypothetical protein